MFHYQDTLKTAFSGKRVLVTGHTGFKGSWLYYWLAQMGAKVSGISLRPTTEPALFDRLGLESVGDSNYLDINDFKKINEHISRLNPEIIFHLAAQPLVRDSYDYPLDTFSTNAMGTAHLLESARKLTALSTVLIVTTDKVYDPSEHGTAFIETDRLGGKDPYSASKACSEMITKSYCHSFFSSKTDATIISARAGNVIGGGDWSKDRLVPDMVRAFHSQKPFSVRFLAAVRPWQHVLDCIHSYLWVVMRSQEKPRVFHGESFNFGPGDDAKKQVSELIQQIQVSGLKIDYHVDPSQMEQKAETKLLFLNTDKANIQLGWKPVLSFPETAKWTAEWYKSFYEGQDPKALCLEQINQFVSRASG